jgi:Fe2+-dicitrate sensor, membrane component
MSIPNDRLQYLVQQYLHDKSTAEELDELWQLMRQLKDESVVQTELEAYWRHADASHRVPPSGWEQVLQQVYSKAESHTQEPKAVPIWRGSFIRWAAAVVVLLLGVAAWWLLHKNEKAGEQPPVVSTTVQDVQAPQHNRATITLSNGQTVYLDSAGNGALASQGNVQLIKLADGQIAYKGSSTELVYNTLINPRGSRIIDITLADGSRIWLNAGSSITYPIAFIGHERQVEIKGEVYFEVAHNPSIPFKVAVRAQPGRPGGSHVEVLGTHFNINAYDDESDVRVTLLEGSVRVSSEKVVVLHPGEQAVLAANASITVDRSPDIQQVMAWKNGLFSFKGSDLYTVMRRLSRWYDIDVQYEGQIPARTFSGEITRDLTLSQLMNGLQSLGIKFSIQGRTMTVQQK